MATVTFQGTRFSAAESETDGGTWDKYGSTQSPTQETDFILQGQYEISNKVSNGTGGVQFLASASVDFSTTPKTIIAKIQVSTNSIIDKTVAEGLSYQIGSSSSAYYSYYLVGSGTGDNYPVNGGWWTIVIDPNVSAHRDRTQGSPSLTTLQWTGLYADLAASVKSENVIHSALDYVTNGQGLLLTGTGGTFDDFVTTDEDTTSGGYYTNRWRLAARSNGSDTVSDAVAWWTIGSSGTSATFSDSNKVVKWIGGRVDTSFHGLRLDLQNASTSVTVSSCTFVSNGVAGTNDSRADFEVLGTSGSATTNGCSFLNFNNITYTSAASQDGGRLECQLLTQNTAHLQNLTIATSSATSVATLQDPTFGTTSGLHDCTFVQNGSGHAIEIDTATSYTLTNIDFSGYGADTTDSAAIDVTASSGTVTLNISGGSTPTYKSAGATVSIVSGAVTVQAKATLKDGTPVENARVYLKAADATGPFPFEETVTITRSGTTATVSHTGHGLATNDKIVLQGITDKTEDNYKIFQITVTGVDSYTYTTTDSGSTSYTGTIKSTFVALNGLTNASGILSTSKVYPSNQPVIGWTRKSTSSPLLQEGILVGEVDSSAGFSGTAVMLADE